MKAQVTYFVCTPHQPSVLLLNILFYSSIGSFYIWGNVRSILSVTLHLFDMSIHVHSQEPNSSSSVEKSSCVTNLIISEKIWIQPLFCCLSKLKDKYHHTGAQVGGKIVLCVRMNFQPTSHSTSAIPKVISFLLRLYQLRNIILNLKKSGGRFYSTLHGTCI